MGDAASAMWAAQELFRSQLHDTGDEISPIVPIGDILPDGVEAFFAELDHYIPIERARVLAIRAPASFLAHVPEALARGRAGIRPPITQDESHPKHIIVTFGPIDADS